VKNVSGIIPVFNEEVVSDVQEASHYFATPAAFFNMETRYAK
jgi:hypothetical protein